MGVNRVGVYDLSDPDVTQAIAQGQLPPEAEAELRLGATTTWAPCTVCRLWVKWEAYRNPQVLSGAVAPGGESWFRAYTEKHPCPQIGTAINTPGTMCSGPPHGVRVAVIP